MLLLTRPRIGGSSSPKGYCSDAGRLLTGRPTHCLTLSATGDPQTGQPAVAKLEFCIKPPVASAVVRECEA